MAGPAAARLGPGAAPRVNRAWVHLRTGLVALVGGALAHLLGIPLPWLIGAMVAVAALGWWRETAVPEPVRPAGLLLLGLGLGQTFTAEVLLAVGAALPALLVAGLMGIVAGLAAGGLFVRLAGTDARTGYYCAVPGGILAMAVLAQRAGLSVPVVTLAQTLRLVAVIAIFPPLLTWAAPAVADSVFVIARPPVWWPGLLMLLAGALPVAFAARALGIANPWMLGPCALTIVLAGSGVLPSGVPMLLVDAAQVGMGAALGAKLTPRFLMGSRGIAVASFASGAVLSALLVLLALPVAWAAGLPVAAVILGMAPGGMPEMTVTAKALDLAVPLVLGFHLLRLLLCNLLVEPVWTLFARWRG